MHKHKLLFLFITWAYSLLGFSANLHLESPAFKLNGLIPIEYTCEGSDKSPPLTWSDAPPQTRSFALIMEDPDAPKGTWTHWVLFNIPSDLNQLEVATAIPQGAAQGVNSWGTLNYRGPCPPNGMHRYVFKLFALDKVLRIENGSSNNAVKDAMTGHVLVGSEWTGVYQKQ